MSVLASGLDRAHGLATFTQIMKVLVRDHLGLDEAPLEITVDGTRRLWGQGTARNRPASDLLLAGRKVVLQAELGEALCDDLVDLGLDLALRQKSVSGRGIVLEAVQLLFKLNGKGHNVTGRAAVLGDPLGNRGQVLALLAQVVLHGEVDEVDDGLGGDELDLVVDQGDFSRCPAAVAHGFVLLEHLCGSVSMWTCNRGYGRENGDEDTHCSDLCRRLCKEGQHLVLAARLLDDGFLGNDGLLQNICSTGTEERN